MSSRGGFSKKQYYKFRKMYPNLNRTTATRRDGYNYDFSDEAETNYKIESVKEPPRLVRSDEYYDYMSNGVKKTKDISIDKFSFKKSRYKQLKKNIAANIKQLRSEKKLNCEDIAQKSGVTRQYIGQIEKGEKNITLEKLCDIAEALDVDVEYLLGKFPKSKAEKYIQLLVMEIQKLSSNRQTNLCIEILDNDERGVFVADNSDSDILIGKLKIRNVKDTIYKTENNSIVCLEQKIRVKNLEYEGREKYAVS